MLDKTRPIFTRPDGSYVVTFRGLPYHLTLEDPFRAEGLWEEVQEHIHTHPECCQPEPPSPPPSEHQIIMNEIGNIQLEIHTLSEKIDELMEDVLLSLASEEPADADILKELKRLKDEKKKLKEKMAVEAVAYEKAIAEIVTGKAQIV